MTQLFDIKIHWNFENEQEFKTQNIFTGQILLYNNGWFEGITTQLNKSSTNNSFICGTYQDANYIEFLKLSSSNEHTPFKFKAQKNIQNYIGEFFEITNFNQEQLYGNCYIVTELHSKITNKEIISLTENIQEAKNNMPLENQQLYINYSKKYQKPHTLTKKMPY